MKKSLCVIPARNNSKGLKDKNILDLCGKPVLAYTIEACLASGLFKDVYVATDSDEYADIAIKYGASVPFPEPEEMAGDFIPSTDPLLYFCEKLNDDSELFWCMQPTSPLRIAEDIVAAYKHFENDPLCEFVLGTSEIDPHFFHWALNDLEDGYCDMYFGKKMLVDRSQLSPMVYRPNGAIKVGKRDSVIKWKHFFGDNIRRVEMPETRSIHIRSQMDLDICKLILSGGV